MADNIRLVIADVDGTLVTQDKILTPRSIGAVKRLREAGIAFSITSGRPPLGMKMLIEPLALSEPIAAFNGGVLVRPDLSVMTQSFLPADIAARVIATIVNYGLGLSGSTPTATGWCVMPVLRMWRVNSGQ